MYVLGELYGKLRELLVLQLQEGISWSTLGISTSAGGWPVKLLPQGFWHVQETEAEAGITLSPLGLKTQQLGEDLQVNDSTAFPYMEGKHTHQCHRMRP